MPRVWRRLRRSCFCLPRWLTVFVHLCRTLCFERAHAEIVAACRCSRSAWSAGHRADEGPRLRNCPRGVRRRSSQSFISAEMETRSDSAARRVRTMSFEPTLNAISEVGIFGDRHIQVVRRTCADDGPRRSSQARPGNRRVRSSRVAPITLRTVFARAALRTSNRFMTSASSPFGHFSKCTDFLDGKIYLRSWEVPRYRQ